MLQNFFFKMFFYSRILFETAGVPTGYLQYAIVLTGLVNFLSLIVFLPLVRGLSRKKLLVYTMILMTVDLVCLVIFMKFQDKHCMLSYLSVACVLIFLSLFAAGLGKFIFHLSSYISLLKKISTIFNRSYSLYVP